MGFVFLVLSVLTGRVLVGFRSSGDLLSMTANAKLSANRKLTNGKPLTSLEQLVSEGPTHLYHLTDSTNPFDAIKLSASFGENNNTFRWLVVNKSELPKTITAEYNLWFVSSDLTADISILCDLNLQMATSMAIDKQPADLVSKIRNQRILVRLQSQLYDRAFGNNEQANILGAEITPDGFNPDTCRNKTVALEMYNKNVEANLIGAAMRWEATATIVGYYDDRALSRFV